MKLTKSHLKQLIKEELQLHEEDDPEGMKRYDATHNAMTAINTLRKLHATVKGNEDIVKELKRIFLWLNSKRGH